jgi:hypothetical protein
VEQSPEDGFHPASRRDFGRRLVSEQLLFKVATASVEAAKVSRPGLSMERWSTSV